MPRPTRGVTWRRCKVNKSGKQYRITWPKDFAESDEMLEGTFVYNPFEKRIVFRKKKKEEEK